MLDKIRSIKLFYKVLLILLLISVVPLILVGWRFININRLSLQDVILELHTKHVTSIADEVESYMAGLKQKILFFISAQGEGAINWTLSQRMLRSMMASNEDFLIVSTLNGEGLELTKVYHPSLEGKVELEDRSKDETFQKSLGSGRFSISELYYTEDKIPVINIVYPFAQELYIFMEVSLSPLLEEVKNTKIGRTGYAYVVDEMGRIVMHPDIELAAKKESMIDNPIVEEVLGRSSIGSKEYINKNGKSVIGAYSPVGALNWGVIIQQDKNEVYNSIFEMRKNALVLLIIVVIGAGIIGYFLTRSFTGPILKLTEAARNIAGGSFNIDFVNEWLAKEKRRDEIFDLAQTFTIMTQQLKKYTDMQADQINAILFSIANGIIMTDYSGNIILSNRRAKVLLNIDETTELDDRNINEIVSNKEIQHSLQKVIEEKEDSTSEIDLGDGINHKVLQTHSQIVYNSETGDEMGTVTVIRDVTLEKEIEQMKDDFMHSITHDLRSPMTSIQGFLEFLLDGTAGDINDQQKEFLEIIQASSDRLLNMINDILDVAKMESGTMPLELEVINFAEIADSVVTSLSGQAQKDNVELIADFKNKINPIEADKDLMHRVLTNLISNGLKFTPSGGSITVSVEDQDSMVQISVADTGSGMPEEYVNKIFDKFEQVKGAKGKRKGTGLGLTITKHIIDSHGGKIWAESELNIGSTFIFQIPRKKTNSKKKEQTNA